MASRQALKDEGSAILEINRATTSQIRAEDALRKTERLVAMGRVAGIIAHEINTPLESITNTFFLLRNHPSLDDEARYFAQLGEEEIQRVSHITRQTLGFYRESKDAVELSLARILDDILDLQSRRLELGNIVIEKHYATAGTPQGFPVKLKQVFLNLIGNAAQAMPEVVVRSGCGSSSARSGTIGTLAFSSRSSIPVPASHRKVPNDSSSRLARRSPSKGRVSVFGSPRASSRNTGAPFASAPSASRPGKSRRSRSFCLRPSEQLQESPGLT